MITRRNVVIACLGLATGAGCLGTENPADSPDYSVPLEFTNDHPQEQTLDITIEDETGEVYKEFGVRVPPETELVVTPFTDLAQTDVAAFIVVVELTAEVSVEWSARMNECFGSLQYWITPESDVVGGPVAC